MDAITPESDLRPLSEVYPYDEAVAVPGMPSDREGMLELARTNRAFFAERCFDPPFRPTKDQRRIFDALDGGQKRLSVRSGVGVGKTASCAVIAIHFLLFNDDTKIVITSPSSNQLKDGMGPEIKKWINRLQFGLDQDIVIQQSRITSSEDPDNNFISFRTARAETPEALQGIHATNVLGIVDEASGVPEIVYDAARGLLSSKDSIMLLIGNPTRSKGLFYRTHTQLSDLWWTIRINGIDSPLVDDGFVTEIERSYGIESNQYRIRVLGEFPESDNDAMIPRYLAEAALQRDPPVGNRAARIWGVDPGRGGDPTGFCARQGHHVYMLKELHTPDTMRVVNFLKGLWEDTVPSERPETIMIDSIGLGGPIADRCRELGLPVADVNVSEAAALREKYPRLRPEIWFNVRQWLEQLQASFKADKPELARQLVDELCEPEMVETTTGKTDLESKQSMRSRGVKSPNLGDALAITFAFDSVVATGASQTQQWSRYRWNQPINRPLQGVF